MLLQLQLIKKVYLSLSLVLDIDRNKCKEIPLKIVVQTASR